VNDAPDPLSSWEIAERENDPSELTRRAYRHPWRTGVISGLLIAGWVLVLDLPWTIALGAGVALMLFTGFMWRPGGPGQDVRRYMLQRFSQKPPRG
jgi:hypothetical protein